MHKLFARVSILCAGTILSLTSLAAQEDKVDLNSYYRFPFSIGAQYQGLTPFSSYGSRFDLYDISAVLRYPLQKWPSLQPELEGGMLLFSPRAAGDIWAHQDFYGLFGVSYESRLSKSMEVGGGLSAGASLSVYNDLVAGEGSMGNWNIIAQASARFALIPAFNFALEFDPSLKYIRSLGAITDFDGLALCVGLSAHIRLGEDPDSPKAVIRSLRFEGADIPPAYSAMQSYYSKNPIGKVTIVNTDKQPLTDIEVSFFQNGYMDAPTPSARLDKLGGGEGRVVPIMAIFNAEVFKLSGGFKPLTGEVIVSYKTGGKAAEQRSSVTYDLYDKTAMTWDDDRKAAAFITPLDSALQNYAAFVGESGKSAMLPGFCKVAQQSMLTYEALREIGMYYQEDPTAPFTRVQADSKLVDFISMPRLTLKRRYGDCKNLTVLFCSLLETRGIKTGFITVPGHIFPAFDTGVAAGSYRELDPDRAMTLAIDGSLWLPVEITMLDGKSSFMVAWKRAITEWKENEKGRAFYKTSAAQETYAPVAVEVQDLGLQYGQADGILAKFSLDLGEEVSSVLGGYQAQASASGDLRDWNRLGGMAANLGQYSMAENCLARAMKLDPKYAPAAINLANVYFLKGDLTKAAVSYGKALDLIGSPAAGSSTAGAKAIALVNLSKTYAALGDAKKAGSALAEARVIDPARVVAMGMGPASGDGTRAASSAGEDKTLVFSVDLE